MDFRKNSTLIIGLLIPFLMIIFVAGSIYIPALFAPPPRYSFLYTSSNDYNYRWTFEVRGDKLVRIDRVVPKDSNANNTDPALYLYNPTTKQNTLVTWSDAQKFTLSPAGVSPDGYRISQGSSGGDFPFGMRDDNGPSLYFRGHNTNIRFQTTTDNGYWNFRFLGWILPQ